MRCDEVRDKLCERPRFAVRLHLVRCASCRREARRLGRLEAALTDLPRSHPAPDLLARVLAVSDGAAVTKPKERTNMRRLAYVVAVMVAAGALAVLVVPRQGKQDARGLLLSVAQAMEQVASMHTTGRSASGGELLPGVVEDWYGTRGEAHRYYDKGSGTLVASRADLDRREWWFYNGRTQTVYRADLTPVMEQANQAVPRLFAFFTSDSIKDLLQRQKWSDARISATTETRNGRQVAVITCDRKLDIEDTQPPIHVTDRYVYEVDPSTHRLVAHRRYWEYGDGTEKLINEVSSIEYDMPLPTQQQLLAQAKEVHQAQATARAIKEDGDNCLVLEYQGERLNRGSILTTMKFPNE